jgi:hypothetical protein
VKKATFDAVELLCGLSEAAEETFLVNALQPEYENSLQILRNLGAVTPASRPDFIRCRSCDADHSVAVEFDPISRRHMHRCTEAGIVWVDDDALATASFSSEWLVRWLASALPIPFPVRRPPLLPGLVWHLGDAVCDETKVTIVFARRMSTQAANITSVLGAITVADKSLVVTTTPLVAGRVQLPANIQFLDLREIGRLVGRRLVVDEAKFATLVRGLPPASRPTKRAAKASQDSRRDPARLDYREADKPFIAEMHAMIVSGTANDPTDAARAVAHRAPGSHKEASRVTRLVAHYKLARPGG